LFANPAVTTVRASPTRSREFVLDAAVFIAAQVAGCAIATQLARWFWLSNDPA
jgi:hypothetical protein